MEFDIFTAIFHGLDLAFTGTLNVAHTKALRATLLRAFLSVATSTLATYVTLNMIFLPIRFVYRITAFVVPSLDKTIVANHLEQTSVNAVKAIPELFVYFFRYIYPLPMDDLFFTSAPPVIARMATLQGRPSTWKRFRLFLKRSIKLGLLLILQTVIFQILGQYLSYLTFAYLTYTTFGLYGAVGTAALSLGTRIRAKDVVTTVLRMGALSREILDPYLCRSKMDDKQRRQWFHKHTFVIASFTLPFYLLMRYTPYIGSLFFGLAMASSSHLCADIMETTDLYIRQT
ncbi:hypothetical protein SmJEL517_g05596 [Synchytrium microbalum]|uniref:Uncharacterized protein n=1 Tax=Synchytrium microbalum TaxID=1806994 RepID=A0A507BYW4_9FUNG|nr:uncharacterized protein SmJEL517_g05596 [Synchytrium microbalum]TPX30936.1 hypothetical protein SmJEL517_g05596 [Synchytrium microbalum]